MLSRNSPLGLVVGNEMLLRNSELTDKLIPKRPQWLSRTGLDQVPVQGSDHGVGG